jgi:hypothetical protein
MTMKTKDITTKDVLKAVYSFQNEKRLNDKGFRLNVVELLAIQFPEAAEKVIYRALDREENRGNIDCGVSIRVPFLTEKGYDLLK